MKFYTLTLVQEQVLGAVKLINNDNEPATLEAIADLGEFPEEDTRRTLGELFVLGKLDGVFTPTVN